jgi:PAS domain S-box-containing protein
MAGEDQAGYYVLMPAEKNAPPEQTSTDRFRLLVDAVQDYGIFMLDTEGKVASWNTGAQRLKQYRPDEIIGRNFSVFYPPEAIAAGWPPKSCAARKCDGRFEDEGWRMRKDGSRFWANVVITALYGTPMGELAGFAKVTRDLTERRQHEEALRASEERFRLLVDSVRDYAIFMLDPDGVIESWNSGAQAIKGYSPRRDHRPPLQRLFTRPKTWPRASPQAELKTARAHGRVEEEGWRVRKDGTVFWANVVITAGLRRRPATARLRQGHARHDRAARLRSWSSPAGA